MNTFSFRYQLFLTFLVPLLIMGCTEDDNGTNDSTDPNNNEEKKGFAFVKDGESFDYSESARYTESVAIIQAQSKLSGTRPYNQVSLGLDSMRIGQFDLHDTIPTPSARYTEFYTSSADDPQIDFEAVEGEIVVDSFDKEKETVTGSFNFIGVSRSSDTVRITEGEFNIKE